MCIKIDYNKKIFWFNILIFRILILIAECDRNTHSRYRLRKIGDYSVIKQLTSLKNWIIQDQLVFMSHLQFIKEFVNLT